MNRIIYNSKLKTNLIKILIVITLFNFIFPNIVFAMPTNVSGSIQDVTDSMTTTSTGSATNPTTLADVGLKKVDELKTKVKEKIKEKFPKLTENEDLDKVYNDYSKNKDKIKVTVRIGGSSYNGYYISQYEVEVNLTQEEIDNTLKKSSDEIEKVDETYKVETAPSSSATGQDPNGGKTQEVASGAAASDIGGILLSPLFYLFNFIADAIIDNVGRIMRPEVYKYGVGTGIGVLQKNPVESGYTNTSNLSVYLSNSLGSVQYPNFKYTPEEIFSGKINILSIDFISGKNADGTEITGDWANIRIVISQWYKILRMIAIIGFLSVLIYTGIKIMISANAKDKAKYKEWIINWLIGIAILFSMHYIMSFIVAVIGEISSVLAKSCQGIHVIPKSGASFSKEFDTNLMGLIRFMIQSEDFYTKIAYEVMYIALIVYTIKFTIVYLKRVLNMAFLTLIAPIVALTYPLDKMNDGQAQGFNMWIKEYVFNALLQPMHLILYYILVGAAVGIAASNPLYGIVVLYFMTEAERLLKKIFGFDKAGGGTVGGMGSAFAAGAVASQIGKVARQGMKMIGGNGKDGNGSGGNGGSGGNLIDSAKPERDGTVEDDFADMDMLDEGNDSEESESEMEETSDSEQNQESTGFTSGAEQSERQQTRELPDSMPAPQLDEAEDRNSTVNSDQDTNPTSPDNGEPIRKKGGVRGGLKNVAKTMAKPIYDFSKKKEYNAQTWKRRGINLLKGAGKAAVGFSVGTAAAAVQAGISITDGKYSPMEGVATFTGGFTGGRALAGRVGRGIANSFSEGYYEGPEGNKALLDRQEKEFLYNDKVDKEYRAKYDEKYENKHKHGMKADDLKEIAAKQMVRYGIKDTKTQFQLQKMADYLYDKKKGTENYTAEQKQQELEKAVATSRKTKNFIDKLDKQGQKSIIGNSDEQEKYIASIIKSQGIEKNDPRRAKIEKSYRNAFKLASIYNQVN